MAKWKVPIFEEINSIYEFIIDEAISQQREGFALTVM